MSIQVDATYHDGVIRPDQPLALPNNTPLHVVVVPRTPGRQMSRDEIEAIRPKSPRFTSEELRQRLQKHAVSVGTLPPDFSREDIYSDHD
jgi:hypothetical protein